MMRLGKNSGVISNQTNITDSNNEEFLVGTVIKILIKIKQCT